MLSCFFFISPLPYRDVQGTEEGSSSDKSILNNLRRVASLETVTDHSLMYLMLGVSSRAEGVNLRTGLKEKTKDRTFSQIKAEGQTNRYVPKLRQDTNKYGYKGKKYYMHLAVPKFAKTEGKLKLLFPE